MSSKDRYISKEDYNEYESYKKNKRKGRLLNPEGLIFLCESVKYDPTELGKIMIENANRFKREEPFVGQLSNTKLYFNAENASEDNNEQDDDFIPCVGN